jgi:acyl transferase domain-containing protein
VPHRHAIVGGMQPLLSPFGFIVFSQASMLSPTASLPDLRRGAVRLRALGGAVVRVLQTAARAARTTPACMRGLLESGVIPTGHERDRTALQVLTS